MRCRACAERHNSRIQAKNQAEILRREIEDASNAASSAIAKELKQQFSDYVEHQYNLLLDRVYRTQWEDPVSLKLQSEAAFQTVSSAQAESTPLSSSKALQEPDVAPFWSMRVGLGLCGIPCTVLQHSETGLIIELLHRSKGWFYFAPATEELPADRACLCCYTTGDVDRQQLSISARGARPVRHKLWAPHLAAAPSAAAPLAQPMSGEERRAALGLADFGPNPLDVLHGPGPAGRPCEGPAPSAHGGRVQQALRMRGWAAAGWAFEPRPGGLLRLRRTRAADSDAAAAAGRCSPAHGPARIAGGGHRPASAPRGRAGPTAAARAAPRGHGGGGGGADGRIGASASDSDEGGELWLTREGFVFIGSGRAVVCEGPEWCHVDRALARRLVDSDACQ